MAICLVCTTNAYGQLSYTYGWESSGLGNWNSAGSTADEFESSQLNPCSGNGSAVANAYDDGYALLTSPDLGASNGGVITLGYSYKVVNFDDETIGAPAAQVLIEVQQAFASSGPWTTVQTINSSNHIVSASCAPHLPCRLTSRADRRRDDRCGLGSKRPVRQGRRRAALRRDPACLAASRQRAEAP